MRSGLDGAKRRLLLIGVAAAFATFVMAEEAPRPVRLELAEGEPARRIEGSIEAFEQVSYVVPLRQGQTLHVALASSNLSHVFDIHAPATPKPVFVGGDSGNSTSLQARVAGEHVIHTYLLRFAARDGQSARYTLEIKVAK